MTAVTEPGLYDGMPEDVYHADPVPDGSLSSTGARRMLPPSCPALYRYEQDHPVFKDVFDFGSAAHKLVLGIGPKVKVIQHDDWRTKDAQEQRKQARATGAIPLLAHEWARVEAMAAAIQDHPLAGTLLDPLAGGKAEQSGFWLDEEFEVWCRLRLDWLGGQRLRSTGQLIVCDYKTTDCAHPDKFAKSAGNFGYDMQDAWYCEGIRQLLGEDPVFWFVAQDKTPPYLVNVVELTPEDRRFGDECNRAALERYRDCKKSGIWPGYGDDVTTITMPPWTRAARGDLL